MSTFVIFIASLLLIVFSLVMKNWEISHGRKVFLSRLFNSCDILIKKSVLHIKSFGREINFKNIKAILLWLSMEIKQIIVSVKRRFDHKQSHFFTKRNRHSAKNMGSVSFFLKDVSDYKKTLREENKD